MKKLILKLLGHKEVYGYEVHKILASEGVELEISHLYRVLNGMLKELASFDGFVDNLLHFAWIS